MGYVVDAVVALLTIYGCTIIWGNYPYYEQGQGAPMVPYVLLLVHCCAAPFVVRHLKLLDLHRTALAWLWSVLPLFIILLFTIETGITRTDRFL